MLALFFCSSTPPPNFKFFILPNSSKNSIWYPFHFECTISSLIYLVRFTVKCKTPTEQFDSWFVLFPRGTTILEYLKTGFVPQSYFNLLIPPNHCFSDPTNLIISNEVVSVSFILNSKFKVLWSHIHLSFCLSKVKSFFPLSLSLSWSLKRLVMRWDSDFCSLSHS